ncbi:hypothetical protein NBH00_02150 [Paraconexibacter antarcticus]|uniref:Uncharacterized protein n=1 Tax=Paraconexibacter antarcticus TaxID=2949664 RepID=A0ABY5DTM0_9ACTN|nr:hypothetical protein [Paraconexibacter antarcticus]UTI65021.1 hypothetical protein NBH00_02150 [Paraconexibacter antarcticus]
MRATPRTRHPVSGTTLRLLTPFFRHSLTRDAWVLRGIGNHAGPVLVRRRPPVAHRTVAKPSGQVDPR